ncbi:MULTISPECIES: hypothetical protein [unclassified Microcoleus]|uniref:hypothetical protein n=1 Tax=unclassified Microcoleus TaxID=2642155 RepID=UPI002FD726CD
MLLVGGGAVSHGFGSGFNGWVVGGGTVSSGFNGWVVGGGAISSGFNGWVVGGGRLAADLVITH